MTVSIARLISFIFNPILVLAVLPFFLVYKATGDFYQASGWVGYTVLFLVAMAIYVVYGVRKGMFTDIDVSKRQQRPVLFLISIFLGLVYLAGLFVFQAPQILFVTTISVIAGVLVASIINNFIKASIHTATISAVLIAIAIVNGGYYFFLLSIIPLVAWARIKEKRHTFPETVIGGLLGILLSLIVYLLVKLVFFA